MTSDGDGGVPGEAANLDLIKQIAVARIEKAYDWADLRTSIQHCIKKVPINLFAAGIDFFPWKCLGAS